VENNFGLLTRGLGVWKTTGESNTALVAQASQAAEKVIYFVIPNEVRNLCSI
jgi:hypothetical protein